MEHNREKITKSINQNKLLCPYEAQGSRAKSLHYQIFYVFLVIVFFSNDGLEQYSRALFNLLMSQVRGLDN